MSIGRRKAFTAFVLSLAFLAGVVSYVWLVWLPREAKRQETREEIESFMVLVRYWYTIHEEVPSGDLDLTIGQMLRDGIVGDGLKQSCDGILSRRDVWGNRYTWVVNGENKEVTLRSRGPDGVDDGGRGDDIEVRSDLPELD